MKVLFLTPWYPDRTNPNHGIFVRDQAIAISQHHDVWVVSAKIDYEHFGLSSLTRTDSTEGKVKETRIEVKQSLPVVNQANYFLRIAAETKKIAREFNPDVIHGNIGYPGAYWAWMMSRILRRPYVVTEHTRITNNFRSFLHKKLTLAGLRGASEVIAVSKWHAKEISSFTGKPALVVPNVIRFEEIPFPGDSPSTDTFQIGFLGNVNTPVKGLDVILEAVSRLKVKFVLHVGGDGVLLEKYKAMARQLKVDENCVFYGKIPYAGVNDFMRKLHVFVSASRWETFGIAMVEALANGLPVVATDCGGPREFIESMNGVIVPLENPDSLREGLEDVLLNLKRFDRYAISESVRRKFSTERFLSDVDAIYGRAVEKK